MGVADSSSKKKPGGVHQGHRQRVKQEFMARGLAGMPDHRALELLLFFSIPQGDVNPLAHELVEQFGSLAGVFTATREQLLAVKGIGENTATLIQLMPALAGRYLEERSSFEGQLTDSWHFKELLMPLFFGARNEMVYVVCMDGKQKLISCRKLGEGVPDQVEVTGRQVVEAALACGATRVALAHNHVSGIAMCSAQDVHTTKYLAQLLRQVGVCLVDHFVIAEDEMVSMRESGYLTV